LQSRLSSNAILNYPAYHRWAYRSLRVSVNR
jgi:hypothetical protein